MVQRDQWYKYWGAKKLNFLIRDVDDDAMAAASVESCQFVVLRSPWDRSGSKLYMYKRLHRTRRRFQHISANSLISAAQKTMNSLAMASKLSEGPKDRRKRYRRLPATRPTSRGLQEPICHQKK